jgi:hypothetical protein
MINNAINIDTAAIKFQDFATHRVGFRLLYAPKDERRQLTNIHFSSVAMTFFRLLLQKLCLLSCMQFIIRLAKEDAHMA